MMRYSRFSDANNSVDMLPMAKLARKLHLRRIEEINQLLKEDEKEFRYSLIAGESAPPESGISTDSMSSKGTRARN